MTSPFATSSEALDAQSDSQPVSKLVSPLRLTLGESEALIEVGDSARIGSGMGARLVSQAPGVELSHATVRVEDDEWILRDHSRSGIWADGRLIVTLRVDGPMAVRMGAPDGPVLILDLESPTDTPDDRPVGRQRRRGLRRNRGRHFRRA